MKTLHAFTQFVVLASLLLLLGGCGKSEFEELTELAEQGDTQAQFELGKLLWIGSEEMVRNRDEAFKWFRKAAEQGDVQAQCYLGIMYNNGESVDEDNDKALKWLHKAAWQGYAPAQNRLGLMYFKGWGVTGDDMEAVKWYYKAAEQGDARAACSLGLIYEKGGLGVDENDAEAVKWYRKAAEQGDAFAQNRLGLMFSKGELSVDQNDADAVKWFRKAANQGAICYDSLFKAGQASIFDGSRAPQDLFNQPAEQGEWDADNGLMRTVVHYYPDMDHSVSEAFAIKSLLEDSGIKTFLNKEGRGFRMHTIGLYRWDISHWGHRLQVFEEDEMLAKRIISKHYREGSSIPPKK